MLFSSILFISIFLPVVMALYYIFPRSIKNAILLFFSLIFYAWGEPVYVVLMLASIIVSYILGLLIGSSKLKGTRAKIFLVISIIFHLGMLGVFKYADFAIGIANKLFGINAQLLELALPIGISFYTFQALSYLIDVYRGIVEPNKNIIDFGAYIAMFPQLIAGPIVRYKTVAEELKGRRESLDDVTYGIKRFTIGLAKKVLLANTIGALWNTISAMEGKELSTATAWLGLLSFTLQIYFDFSGYSDMAIGLGRMFGFHFLENFDYPYESKSITEFWRRWHMSLGTWFREYVYYPLGGNKKGIVRQLINIFIVWMLTGLWHGASLNFVIWGLFYGVLLLIEKVGFYKILEKMPSLIARCYTLIMVVIGWGIFSYEDIKYPKEFFSALFFNADLGLVSHNALYLLTGSLGFIILGLIGSTSIPKTLASKIKLNKNAGFIIGFIFTAILLCLSMAFIVSDTYNPFLYFRF
ncbi:MAG: MBOAT family protein [Lachnospiraceae bacterium]|nr:MBOAT family protein [Lachnospiraceae bacterium]